jgi:hypothetical protein
MLSQDEHSVANLRSAAEVRRNQVRRKHDRLIADAIARLPK